MEEILTVVEETKILGQDVHLYRSIEEPLFEASEVAGWLDIQNVSQMLKQAEIDESVDHREEILAFSTMQYFEEYIYPKTDDNSLSNT